MKKIKLKLMVGFFLVILNSTTMADCEYINPEGIQKLDTLFYLRYYIYLTTSPGSTIQLNGYLTRNDAENKINRGIFYFNNTSLYLTGREFPTKGVIKKFLIKQGEKIKFTKNTNDSWVASGYFDEYVWGGCSNASYSPYPSYAPCTIYKFDMDYTCVKKKGEERISYTEFSPRTPYYPSKTLTDLKEDIPSGSTYKSDKIGKIEYVFSRAKPILKSNKPRLGTILKNKKKKKILTSKRICDTKGNHLSSIKTKIKTQSYIYMGLLKNNKKTKAFWFDSELATAPNPEKFTIDLSSLKNKYIPIELSSHIKNTDKNNIIPIKFESLHSLPRTSSSLEKKPKTNKIKIIIIGDTNSISFSGIDKAEKILLKRNKNIINWDIHWFNVDSKGDFLPRQNFSSFKKLIHLAHNMKKEKVLLSRELQFTTFLKNFEQKILQYKNTIDYVIWVKDSYSLPLKSPDLFYSTLEKIQKRGKLSRFKNGKPYQWLYLLSGNMPGGNRSLLEEPMARLDPIPGQIEEEKKMLEPRRLLQKPDRLATALGAVVIRHQKQLPAELRISSNNLYINAKEALAKIGLLIPLKKLKKPLQINKSILDKIREKNYTKASKNKCTHIFFNKDDMGLKWLK